MSESGITYQREHWSSRTAFVFASIGSAIGLGNIWRFPRICAENGGFAFLVVFIIALFSAGIPILILELAMGERTQKATPGAFRYVGKKFEWFGWCVVGVAFMVACYYAVIMSWCWNYVVYSFHQSWGDDPAKFFIQDFLNAKDTSELPQSFGGVFKGWGTISYAILAGTALSWAAVIFCIWRGVKTVSKVVYATVVLPWLLLLVFVFRGVTLPGAAEGLAYYLTPQEGFWDAVFNRTTWMAAYTQVFYSVSVGLSIMFAYGSFLDKETDIVRNAFLIGISDAITAIVAGLAVFGCLGHLATPEGGGIPIEEWMDGSLGIAFIAYPKMISLIPLGSILGPLFFLMLLLLAIDSSFSIVEGCIKPLEDKFGWSHKKAMFTVCGAAFLLGLPFMFQTGLYWFDTLDHFMNYFGLVGACFVECIVFGYFYGAGRIRAELLEHRENRLGRWFTVAICLISPIVLIGLVVWEVQERLAGSYEGYGRVTEFYGGWLMLILIAAAATVFTLLKGSNNGGDTDTNSDSGQ